MAQHDAIAAWPTDRRGQQPRQCIWRTPKGSPDGERCTAMFTPINAKQRCCLDHGVGYQGLCQRRRKLLKAAGQ